MVFTDTSSPGLSVPGAVSPGAISPTGTTIYTYVGSVPRIYLRYLLTTGTLLVTPGQVVTYLVSASDKFTYPIPPPDGRWLVNGVYPGQPMFLKERITSSEFSIHDEWCSKCYNRHWQTDCLPVQVKQYAKPPVDETTWRDTGTGGGWSIHDRKRVL